MEIYEGVKFQCVQKKLNFDFDDRLHQLNNWVYLLSELGLTPLHPQGASGNHSYRSGKTSFVITKSGMVPEKKLVVGSYSSVLRCDEAKGVIYSGQAQPSSESLLHHLVYLNYENLNCVMHGHSHLLLQYADNLALPVTHEYYAYGTSELAKSVLDVMDENNRFVILKDHGFVAVGESVRMAGKLVLKKYAELLRVLQGEVNDT